MKIYKITNIVGNEGFACMRQSNKQYVREVEVLDVWWDDWCSGGKKIGDFVECMGADICKVSVFEELHKHFDTIKSVPLRIFVNLPKNLLVRLLYSQIFYND